MNNNKRREPRQGDKPSYCTVYTHYRTGKRMVCFDYGHKAWPFGRKKR